MKAFKFVTKNMKSGHGDVVWKPKEWNEHKSELSLCNSGFHACIEPLDAFNYVQGDRLFIVEYKGKVVKGDDKLCAEKMRLIQEIDTKKLSVWFSIRCARRVLKNWTKAYPKDDRPLKAIEAAENWLKNPTDDNMKLCGSAARSAESAAWSAESAAESAARSARSAARSARSAAWSAESAAESAAWSARSAAWSARSAAWSARSAESAERTWQKKEMRRLVKKCLIKEATR